MCSMETTIAKKRVASAHRTEFANLTMLKAAVLTDSVLTNFIADRSKKSLKDLRGKISFREDYDYKLMRS